MRWPRRRWAVTQYYYGVADRVVSRHWSQRAARRAVGRALVHLVRKRPGELLRGVYDYRVTRREGR